MRQARAVDVTHLVTHLVRPHGGPISMRLCGPCRIDKKPILVFLILSSLPLNELVLPTPTVSWSELFHLFTTLCEKKYLLTSQTLCFFFNLNVSPLVPLIFAVVKGSQVVVSRSDKCLVRVDHSASWHVGESICHRPCCWYTVHGRWDRARSWTAPRLVGHG